MPAFDAVGPSSAGASNAGTSPLNWTHTPVGTPTVAYVGISVGHSVGTNDTTYTVTATYGGTAMTAMSSGQSSGFTGMTGNGGFIKVFKLVSPPSGAQTVSVTVTGSGLSALIGGSITVTGIVSGESALVNGFAQSVTGFTVNVPSTTTGNLCLAFESSGNGGEAWTVGTLRYKADVNANSGAGNSTGATQSSASGSTSMTETQASDWYGVIAFESQAGAAAAGLLPQQLRHRGPTTPMPVRNIASYAR